MVNAGRLQDWPVRLAQAIEEARDRSFAWGTHDCAGWAFTVAFSLRGKPKPGWVGTYKTKAAAMRKLKASGVALEDIGTELLGPPLEITLMAGRGDVAFAGGAYGVCIGTHIAQITADGLTFRPMADAEKAWRV